MLGVHTNGSHNHVHCIHYNAPPASKQPPAAYNAPRTTVKPLFSLAESRLNTASSGCTPQQLSSGRSGHTSLHIPTQNLSSKPRLIAAPSPPASATLQSGAGGEAMAPNTYTRMEERCCCGSVGILHWAVRRCCYCCQHLCELQPAPELCSPPQIHLLPFVKSKLCL